MRFKFSACFVLLITISIIIINNYPPMVVQNQIITAKKNELVDSLKMLSVVLESFPELSVSNIESSVGLLNIARNRLLIVTDENAKVLYDSRVQQPLKGKYAVFPQIFTAMTGKDIFVCTYDELSFHSRAASPIIRGKEVRGVIYIDDYDTENALFLSQTRSNILGISLVVFATFSIFIFTMMQGFSRRIGTLLSGVEQVRQGDLSFKIFLSGKDELYEIASEFNTLTGKLESDEQTRRRFVSDASHELKTPLASIKLLSDSIVQTEHINIADVKEFLTDITDEIDRLTDITENLLQLSQLDALPSTKLNNCNLHNVAEKCCRFLSANAAQMNVSVNNYIPPHIFVWGNDSGLHHVVFNLLQNAIKYNMPHGSVTLSATEDESNVVLKVSDTGIGISHDEIERVFDRFYRVDRARSRATGGSGLGLSIVSQWVQSMYGYIEVDSKINVGSEFRVYLKKHL